MYNQYPSFHQQYEDNERMLGEAVTNYLQQQQLNSNARIEAIYYIPIVFHVVLPNPNVVTDAMVFAQLDRINLDYSGLNPDSANGTPFYGVRGHSKIQFCLAQRTPANTSTNGIERITSSTLSAVSVGDPIKHASSGGADAWDPNKYVNIWVGRPSDPVILGYGSFPIGTAENNGGFPLNEQGVFITSGTLPGGNAAPYNGGRTLSHELGHFFWLRHTWGDANCGNDFPNTPGIDDTPLQSDATFGCPSGAVATGCSGSPTPPGRMYQSFMDYTDDGCMTMFSKGQIVRAEQALILFRPSLLTSNGCQPIVPVPNDASIAAIVTPANNSGCQGATAPLTITLKNEGSNILTSATITVEVNGATAQTFNWVGNLAAGASVNVNLNPVNLVVGSNTVAVCSSSPNATADAVPANDCRFSITFRAAVAWPAGAIPLVEGFEGAAFPPANWTRVNPDNDFTWQRNTVGVSHGGIANAFINHFNYFTPGEADDLISPSLTLGAADSLWVSFWGAYKGYPGFPFEIIEVGVSTNCGSTFTPVYTRNANVDFAEDPITTTLNWAPSNISQWKKKSLDLSSFIPSGNVIVRFRMINQVGNNMFLDDINIDKKVFPNYDAGVIAINKPDSKNCTSSLAPVVVIKNFGKVNLTSVKINYQVDGTGPVTTFNWTGNLARNQTATVTLATASLGAVGNHSISIYTTLPNNVADEDPSNDGLVKPYLINQILALPGSVTEEFTSATFPPTNWQIFNPNADLTWQRNSSVGKKNPGSAFVNDFVNTSIDRIDDLAMPNYSYTGIDSIFLTFNLAHITRKLPGTTGSRLDTLTVLLSKDCGNTFTTIYKKYGEELQTVNDPNFQISFSNFTPLPSQWRKDSLNLGKWLGASEPLFQVVYRFSGNMENNFYLDDVNLRTQILPARLKNDGYLVLPNPFRNTFGVWHYQVPTTLRYINVYNSVGQLVYSKQFPGGGEKYFQIDLAGRAAGTYTVNLGYEDSNRNINVQVVKY